MQCKHPCFGLAGRCAPKDSGERCIRMKALPWVLGLLRGVNPLNCGVEIHGTRKLFHVYFKKLRYNSHNLKVTILKNIIQWYLVHSKCCATITCIQLLSIFVISKGNPSHSPFLPLPAPENHPSLWICLFWTFHVNGIIQCVTVCVRLLTFRMCCGGSSKS